MCVSFVCGIERLAATFHIRVDDGSSSVCCLFSMLEEWCDEEKCSLDFIFSKSISTLGREMRNVSFSLRTKDFSRFFSRIDVEVGFAERPSPYFLPIKAEPSGNHVQTGRNDNHRRRQSIHAVFAHGKPVFVA